MIVYINTITFYLENKYIENFSKWEVFVMKERFKNELLLLLNKYVPSDKFKTLSSDIDIIIHKYDIKLEKNEIIPYEYKIPDTIQQYIVIKKIEGRSDKSLYLYNLVLTNFFETVHKTNEQVTANDIRLYLFQYQKEHDISNRTLDCRRIIICTYFTWLASEGYIQKDPTINVNSIKFEKKHKKPMSQLDLEKIRLACETNREKAIVELLYSTGCRVSELEHLNISDVNFEAKEVMLFGKGNKHRVSYLNAKAEVSLKNYLKERTDNNEALFVQSKKPYNRLKKSGIELIIKNIVNRTNGLSVHITPHVFRHTTASVSLERGMNVVEVSKLLGHSKIETTMEYITTNSSSLKSNHKNCVI